MHDVSNRLAYVCRRLRYDVCHRFADEVCHRLRYDASYRLMYNVCHRMRYDVCPGVDPD